MAQEQQRLERRALNLAAAWSDFDMAEHSAIEIVRRFGAIEPTEHGRLRLHKQPLFVALHTACVLGYTRPYAESELDPKYAEYAKPEWQDLHDTLFVWKERLAGKVGVTFRQFMIAQAEAGEGANDRYVLGEVTSILEPARHFRMLREMCADRKALLWADLQDAIAQCYPALSEPIVLGFGTSRNRR